MFLASVKFHIPSVSITMSSPNQDQDAQRDPGRRRCCDWSRTERVVGGSERFLGVGGNRSGSGLKVLLFSPQTLKIGHRVVRPNNGPPKHPIKNHKIFGSFGECFWPCNSGRFLEGSVVRPMDLNQKRPATETGGSLITPRSPKHALVRATELNGRERLAGEPRNIVPIDGARRSGEGAGRVRGQRQV